MKVWIGVPMLMCVLFMAALASPWARIVYLPDFYSWSYDYSLAGSSVIQRVEQVIEVFTIFRSA